MSKYTVKIAEGQGFPSTDVGCDTISEACAIAIQYDDAKIYKDGVCIA